MASYDKDDQLWLEGRSGGELSPPMTPEQIEQRRQFLGLRPMTPYVPKPPRKRKRRSSKAK
ncbi:MAG: hypothetical protein WBW53_06110 [Terriglobales bacterium]